MELTINVYSHYFETYDENIITGLQFCQTLLSWLLYNYCAAEENDQ